MTKEIEKLKSRSLLIRHRSARAITDLIGPRFENSVEILGDSELVTIKRCAEERYLDFPNTLRGHRKEGFLRYRSDILHSDIGDFLSNISEESVFVFVEPWLLRGGISINTNLLKDKIWDLLELSDYSLKIYNNNLTKSCIINESDRSDSVRFSLID